MFCTKEVGLEPSLDDVERARHNRAAHPAQAASDEMMPRLGWQPVRLRLFEGWGNGVRHFGEQRWPEEGGRRGGGGGEKSRILAIDPRAQTA